MSQSQGRQSALCPSLLAGTLVVLTGAAGCLMPTGDDGTGGLDQSIINGQAETGYPSAVYLTNILPDASGYQAQPFCSGVVIAPTVVLTAAHCVETRSPANPGFGVGTGAALDASGIARFDRVVVPAAEIITHPFYHDVDVYGRDARPTDWVMHDLALVYVGTPLDVTPATVSYSPPAANATGCATLRAVGYGRSTCGEGNPTGERKSATVCLRGDANGQFNTVADTGHEAPGDSGGPIFAGEASQQNLVGIHWGGNCDGVSEKGIFTAFQRRLIDGGIGCASAPNRFACLFPTGSCVSSADRYCSGIQVACKSPTGCSLYADALEYQQGWTPTATATAAPAAKTVADVYEVLASSGDLLLVRRSDGAGGIYWTFSAPTNWELVPAAYGYGGNYNPPTPYSGSCTHPAGCGAYVGTNLLNHHFGLAGAPFARDTEAQVIAYDRRGQHACGVFSAPSGGNRFTVSIGCQADGWRVLLDQP